MITDQTHTSQAQTPNKQDFLSIEPKYIAQSAPHQHTLYSLESFKSHFSYKQWQVVRYLLRFYWLSEFRKSVEAISKETGISIRTVERTTHKLALLEALDKYQPLINKVNIMSWSKVVVTPDMRKHIFFDGLSRLHIALLLSKKSGGQRSKIRIRNIKKPPLILSPRGDRGVGLSLYQLKRERLGMLSLEARNYISERKHKPDAKEVIRHPEVWRHIQTPLIKEIAQELKLDEREVLKCLAFPDVSLKQALQELISLQNNTQQVYDPKAFFFWRASEICKVNSWRIEWAWYCDVCFILGIEPFQRDSFSARPKKEKSSAKKERKKPEGIYAPWKGHIPRTIVKTDQTTLETDVQRSRANEFKKMLGM